MENKENQPQQSLTDFQMLGSINSTSPTSSTGFTVLPGVTNGNGLSVTGGCCSSPSTAGSQCCERTEKWITGYKDILGLKIPQISTTLATQDRIGAWKVRWGIGRMNYTVEPGLYAVGNPDSDPQSPSAILVTANYKLTFDVLRKELEGQNCWLLVLDTKGINVWCAAGKGTFGTAEILNRVAKTNLSLIVKGRTLILPQLGAPGVVAHEVTKKIGFKVVYGPIEAKDVPAFMAAGFKATEAMRRVKFTFYDRLVLTPMEFVGTLKPSLMLFGVFFLLNIAGLGGFGRPEFFGYGLAVLGGCVVVPILLPWIPGRSFAWKGWLVGTLSIFLLLLHYGWPGSEVVSLLKGLGYLLTFPMLSAYFAMNFTGCSTYTSLSGVMKEMRIAMPVMAISVVLGSFLIIIGSLLGV